MHLPGAQDIAVETEYLLILSRYLGSIDAQAKGFLRCEPEEISRTLNALRAKVEASRQR